MTGTYRWAPESASSRSRYAPAGQSSVGTCTTGSQSVTTVLVGCTTAALFCLAPCTGPEDQTLRAPVPWYQPSRNAVTRKPLEVVETNSGNDSPVSTLAVPVYPSISCSAPRLRSCQCGSPGSEFSGTGGFHGRGERGQRGRMPGRRGAAEKLGGPGRDPGRHARRGQAEEGSPARLPFHPGKHATYEARYA